MHWQCHDVNVYDPLMPPNYICRRNYLDTRPPLPPVMLTTGTIRNYANHAYPSWYPNLPTVLSTAAVSLIRSLIVLPHITTRTLSLLYIRWTTSVCTARIPVTRCCIPSLYITQPNTVF